MLFLGFLLVGCGNASAPATSGESARQQVEQVEVSPGVEQVVVFTRRNDPAELQSEVNAWFRQNHGKVEIVRVLQSQGGAYSDNQRVTITVFYKKTG
jgi:hypothetical protein